MRYYLVNRRITSYETVRVRAESKYDAFEKAGLDEECEVVSEHDDDYEADYHSVIEGLYVGPTTLARDLAKEE